MTGNITTPLQKQRKALRILEGREFGALDELNKYLSESWNVVHSINVTSEITYFIIEK